MTTPIEDSVWKELAELLDRDVEVLVDVKNLYSELGEGLLAFFLCLQQSE